MGRFHPLNGIQKEKLQDPEYLKYMVRGKYLVTKDGEQVFKLPTTQDDS